MASALSFSAAVTGKAVSARPVRRTARRAAVAARAGGLIKVRAGATRLVGAPDARAGALSY
jgi:hypothetical protein